jgi:LacI family transcriptional regulator
LDSVSTNKIRIKDIAEKANVSVGTVDRVLHNRGEVAEKTRKQVLSIVKDLGYTPNLVAKSLALKKTYQIAALIPDSANDNPYWEKPLIGINQAFSEIKDFSSNVKIFTFDNASEASFKNTFNDILEEKPDGLVFTPVFFNASHKVVEKCDELGIPYVFIDVNIDGCNNLTYFGQNAEQSGYLAAKLMYYMLPAGAHVLVIKPATKEGVTHHLRKREKGFLSFYLSSANQKNILATSLEIDITSQKLNEESLSKIFSEHDNINGIFVTNSRVFKVAEYIAMTGLKNIFLIGYDLIRKNLDFLEKGIINFLIGQKPEEQGYKSILALFNFLLSGKKAEKTNYSPIDIIMKENIDYYKNYKF